MPPLLSELFTRTGTFMTTGIAGSEFTPLRLAMVISLIAGLVWATRRATHWFVDGMLARRGVDVAMRRRSAPSCATASSRSARW
jgi:hypothetical protein